MKKVTDVFNRSTKSLTKDISNTLETVKVEKLDLQDPMYIKPVEHNNPKDNEVERLTRLMNKTKSSRIKKKLQKRIAAYGK